MVVVKKKGLFVEDALLVFRSGQKSGNYYSSIHSEDFCKWLDQELLPKLESLSIIILDNSKYHKVETDKKPNTASPRSYIVNWLSQHGVDVN